MAGQHISWNINHPVSKAKLWDSKKNDFVTIPPGMLDKKVAVRKGDRITILFQDGKPLFTEPLGAAKTLRGVFTSIERGLDRKIPKDKFDVREKVYRQIAAFFHYKHRMPLVKKFEAGILKVRDLLGDHVFWEGGLKRGKGGIWTYGLGS